MVSKSRRDSVGGGVKAHAFSGGGVVAKIVWSPSICTYLFIINMNNIAYWNNIAMLVYIYISLYIYDQSVYRPTNIQDIF